MMQFQPTGGDDTAALQAAIASASSLEILSGISKISAPLVIDHECEIIWRSGARLWADHPSCDVLSVESRFVRLVEPRIEAVNPRTGGSFIRAKTGLAHSFKIEGGILYGYWTGVSIDLVMTATINDLDCLGGVSGQAAAIEVDGVYDGTIANLKCDAGPSNAPAAGVLVRSCGDLLLTDSNIMRHGHDLMVCPGAGQVVASLWVTDTFLDTANRGALFIPSNGGQVVRCKLSNVWASGHADQGILLLPQSGGAIDGLDIAGLHCFLNGSSGVQVEAGTKNVRMIGGAVAQNVQSGIVIGANVDRFAVHSITSGPTDGLSGNGGYGMLVYGSSHNRYRITDNSFSGNSAGGLLDQGTGANKVVGSNL
jgi:hypothetical protein